MSYPAIALDTMAATQHVVTFNELAEAMSKAALFGVKESNGLNLTLYGGAFPTDAGPVVVANQSVVLTASATNYISANTSGVVTKVTAAPTGWPGPMATGNRALYELVTDADAITAATVYRIGPTTKGVQGQQGATGAAGAELWSQRKRSWQVIGDTNWMGGSPGFSDVTEIGSASSGTIAVGSGSLLESVPRVIARAGSVAADVSGGVFHPQNLWHFGSAAGRGGFDVSFRFGFDGTYGAGSNIRWFVGLKDAGVPTASVDPSALINLIGVGGDGADTNASLMHNDGSGTATKTAFATPGNYPKYRGATDLVYELRLWCAANASAVNYTFLNAGTGNTETGSLSTNLPANTQMLSWIMYANTGSGGTNAGINVIQVVGNSRY